MQATRHPVPASAFSLGLRPAGPGSVACGRPCRAGRLLVVASRAENGRRTPSANTGQPPVQRQPARQAPAGKNTEQLAELGSRLSERATDLYFEALRKWDDVEDKPSLIVLGGVTLLTLALLDAVLDRMEALPLVAPLLETVGILVSSIWAYKMYRSPEYRAQTMTSLKEVAAKMGLKFM